MLKVGVVEHPKIFVPATAVGGASTVTLAVLKLLNVELQFPDDKLVTVIVVLPTFKEGVVKVPVPGLPAVKFIVAVNPVAVVAPDKL